MGKGEKYDVVIIGAGIGGLVCGCYLVKAGLKVLIVERNDKPGGYCSSFERDGYRFDVGPHYLGGIKRGVLGKILEELEVKDQIKFHQSDPTDKIIMPDNVTYIRADLYDTVKEFKKSFPKEKRNIEKFFKFVMQKDFLEIYRKTRKLTFKQILDEFFDDYRLKGTLNVLLGNIGVHASIASGLSGVVLYREFILDPGYYPSGGMQNFSNTLANKFKEYGGEIIFCEEVKKIIIENNNEIKGVVTKKNRKIFADKIISAIDATYTFEKLLDIKSKEQKMVSKLIPTPSVFAVYLGLNVNLKKNLSGEFPTTWVFPTYSLRTSFILKKDDIEDEKHYKVMFFSPSFHTDNFDENKSVVEGLILVSFETVSFWNRVKRKIAQNISRIIEEKGGISKEWIDIQILATPFDFYKFTLNKNGSPLGWMPTLKQIRISKFPPFTSIKNLFLVGHWTTIGSAETGITGVSVVAKKVSSFILANF